MQEADVMAQRGELSVVEEDRPGHHTTEIARRGDVERTFGCVQQFVGVHALPADFREVRGGDRVCGHLNRHLGSGWSARGQVWLGLAPRRGKHRGYTSVRVE